jgi:hypothetical protein
MKKCAVKRLEGVKNDVNAQTKCYTLVNIYIIPQPYSMNRAISETPRPGKIVHSFTGYIRPTTGITPTFPFSCFKFRIQTKLEPVHQKRVSSV